MNIIPETINRIRLSDKELILLKKVLEKVNKDKLITNERMFYDILFGRVEGRLKLKKKGMK
ncbi:MAG: hypothetical protein KJ718_05125 [Nanoarchaeota archaeon]|nr:hypothetical protein [Nanoarchaeota archaeon]MBU1051908.1 hypothetical protein [Nanoarchaeota archaeon]